jgi:hypothetical protein
MSTANGGRSLQDCFTSIGATVKRRKHGEELSSAKRQCVVLKELLPLVLARRDEDNGSFNKNQGHDSNKPDRMTVDFVEYAKEQKLLVSQDMERIQEKRRTFFSKQSDLVGVYIYGLDKISRLADVRDAPDAILPGNQV